MRLTAGFSPLPVILLLALTGCGAMTEHRVGVVEGELTKCPEWPRCVSSQEANSDKQVDPLVLTVGNREGWDSAMAAVADMERTTIVEERDGYLRAEIISPWRFYTDDLELLLMPEEGIIHVRSTGRIGYYDFNVNRDRAEALRSELVQRGVVMAP
ncbi:MAG: DUF1499 domain-containing protein [Halomonadaceae bacterium]|nr:MAG: DUF1499 domain-containing protein [Halomonadaceae bacterium]